MKVPPTQDQVTAMKTENYWPLDYDPECEIYDNPAWNLPGFRAGKRKARVSKTKSSKAYPVARRVRAR